MPENMLPDEFADLIPLVAEWALPTEVQRCHKRLGTDIAVLKAFHAQMFPRIEEIIRHLNGFPNDPEALPPDAKRLFDLALMDMEAAAPIDLDWPSSDIRDVFPIDRFEFLPVKSE